MGDLRTSGRNGTEMVLSGGVSFPEMAGWALEGRLDLDGMVTRELDLTDLDEAFRAMLAGEVIRSVVVFDP